MKEISTLESYVKKGNQLFWSVISEKMLSDGSFESIINVSGLKWKGVAWHNRVMIMIPAHIKYRNAAMMSLVSDFKEKRDDLYAVMAARAQTNGIPFILICDEPNQPLFDLKGTQLIFYTFERFVKTSQEDWPLLFPMVKSVVYSMNATQQYLEAKHLSLEKFFMFGISKLGWVTYLTGAIDPRIFAIAPMAYDSLNFLKQLEHQLKNWSVNGKSILSDLGLTFSQAINLLNSEKGRKLMSLVDPYSYIEKLRMPKLIVDGTNDELWPVDAGSIYFYDLPGKNYVLYLPNKKHKIEYELSIVNTVLAFFKSSLKNEEFVDLRWSYSDESLFITAEPFPISATGWMSKSKTLDFRNSHWMRIGGKMLDKKYVVRMEPLKGLNTCYLGEATFKKYGIIFKLTTLPKIVEKK